MLERNIAEIVKTLFSVLLGTGTLFGALQYSIERRKRKDGVEYLATRIAILLEGYAICCTNKLSDFDLFFTTNGILGELIHDVPKFPEIPDGDYKLLNRFLLDEFLQLPQNIEMAYNVALRDSDFADEIQGNQIRIDYIISLGSKAIKLANLFREQYKLPKRNIKIGKMLIKDFFNNRKPIDL
jgi:hypothetical protein